MSNDTKWLELEKELPFVPYPGFNFTGIAGEQELKISGMSYDISKDLFKIRLSWLSMEPMNADDMVALNIGWKIKS